MPRRSLDGATPPTRQSPPDPPPAAGPPAEATTTASSPYRRPAPPKASPRSRPRRPAAVLLFRQPTPPRSHAKGPAAHAPRPFSAICVYRSALRFFASRIVSRYMSSAKRTNSYSISTVASAPIATIAPKTTPKIVFIIYAPQNYYTSSVNTTSPAA